WTPFDRFNSQTLTRLFPRPKQVAIRSINQHLVTRRSRIPNSNPTSARRPLKTLCIHRGQCKLGDSSISGVAMDRDYVMGGRTCEQGEMRGASPISKPLQKR